MAGADESSITPIGVQTQKLEQIPGLPPSERAAVDLDPSAMDAAQNEARVLSSGKSREELAEDAARNEHSRSERFRNHFETLAIVGLWAASGSVLIIAGIWIAHLILPPSWRWLTIEDISHLQSIATAGLLVGVIGNHFKKRLG